MRPGEVNGISSFSWVVYEANIDIEMISNPIIVINYFSAYRVDGETVVAAFQSHPDAYSRNMACKW